MKTKLFYFLLLVFVWGCQTTTNKDHKDSSNEKREDSCLIKKQEFASLFSLEELEQFKFYSLHYRDKNFIHIYHTPVNDSAVSIYYFLDRDSNKIELPIFDELGNLIIKKKKDFSPSEIELTHKAHLLIEVFTNKMLEEVVWEPNNSSLFFTNLSKVKIGYNFNENKEAWDFSYFPCKE